MKKSKAVPVSLVASVAALALASGCGSRPYTHQRVCGDAMGIAVEPEKCEQELPQPHAHGYVPLYHWYYGPYGRSYPVGAPLAGASLNAPTGSGVRIASPSSTTRGGFGSSAQSSGS